jgi:DUF1680 family protein
MDRQDLRARIDSGFWLTFQRLVRDRVIPYQWKAMNDRIPDAPKSHSVENFRIAAGRAAGSYEGMVFQDSDLAKWLEAVGQVLADGGGTGSTELRGWADEAVELVAAAQQPDGYVNTYFTVKAPAQRWKNLRDAHELYCAGHLIEAGVSLYRGSGNQKILQVVRRFADLIDATFGREPGKLRGYCGHQEVELALMKLYRLTGERRYLERARYFIDERGARPSWFEKEAQEPGFVSIFGAKPLDYYQAHRPVREQREAVGHAVRAMYLYTAMADVAQETGDASLVTACERLWENTTGRKMYLTGGIGSSAIREAFGAEFDLPNDTAYAETCAAIGLFLFSARMLRLRDEARYADVMERCLYNGVISGLALDGESYFYVNPLEVVPAVCDGNPSYQSVKYRRQPWYGCACCPPNIARTIAALGEHMYHDHGDVLFADLYHGGSLTWSTAGVEVGVRQRTGYPWTADISFEIDVPRATAFTLALRVPAWCRAPQVSLNGTPAPAAPGPDGYIRVRRTWNRGESVKLTLPMAARRVYADPRVRSAYGKVAVERGPLVYCLEEVDNGPDLHAATLPSRATLSAVDRPDLLGGVVTLEAAGVQRPSGGRQRPLYADDAPSSEAAARPLRFVPYYAWANRAPGEMTVWVQE